MPSYGCGNFFFRKGKPVSQWNLLELSFSCIGDKSIHPRSSRKKFDRRDKKDDGSWVQLFYRAAKIPKNVFSQLTMLRIEEKKLKAQKVKVQNTFKRSEWESLEVAKIKEL